MPFDKNLDGNVIAHVKIDGKLHKLSKDILTKQKHKFGKEDWQFLRKVMDKKKLVPNRHINKFHLANPINFKYIRKSKYLEENLEGEGEEPGQNGISAGGHKNKKVQIIVNKYLNQ